MLSNIKNNFWELTVVGDGDLRLKYIQLARKFKIDSNVKFLGNVEREKLPSIYRQSDLFILPSINKNEAFGLVLLEAMASGIPVIASNLPGVNSVFNNQVEGYLTAVGDVKDIRNKINYFMDHPEAIIKMGQRARELVLEKYDYCQIADNLEQIYKNILK